MPLYLANANYLDPVTLETTRGNLLVESGPAGGFRFVDAAPEGAEQVDCSGRLVTKSFAVGHHHIYSALARGMPPPKISPTNFVQILEQIWWKLDSALDEDMIRSSALVAAIEAAKCGSTFIIDHHASPNAAPGSLGIIADALDEVGLGHLLCYELSDRDGPERMEQGLAETDRHLQNHQGLVGLHASFTVSPGLLERACELAAAHKTGIHVHVAEAQSDQDHCLEHFGTRCVQRFDAAGVLEMPRSILAHCIHLDDVERDLLRDAESWVAQQAESNLNNAVGTLDATGFAERVFIGTDGMHGDCIAAARQAYLASQGAESMSPQVAYGRLRRVHAYLRTNSFTGDSDNNLIVLDYDSPTPISPSNWPGHVMYGLSRHHVRTVISQGRVIVDEGRATLVDESAVMAEARVQAKRLWDRL
ncbi:MAG: cytosine/adenosine deaminase-related metal-dependent hydrolase [Phycisphaerales bacterium]